MIRLDAASVLDLHPRLIHKDTLGFAGIDCQPESHGIDSKQTYW